MASLGEHCHWVLLHSYAEIVLFEVLKRQLPLNFIELLIFIFIYDIPVCMQLKITPQPFMNYYLKQSYSSVACLIFPKTDPVLLFRSAWSSCLLLLLSVVMRDESETAPMFGCCKTILSDSARQGWPQILNQNITQSSQQIFIHLKLCGCLLLCKIRKLLVGAIWSFDVSLAVYPYFLSSSKCYRKMEWRRLLIRTFVIMCCFFYGFRFWPTWRKRKGNMQRTQSKETMLHTC